MVMAIPSSSDSILAFDLDGAAGQSFRAYQAAFDRELDVAGITYWVNELDEAQGDLVWLGRSFLESRKFTTSYGDYRDMSAAPPLGVAQAVFICLAPGVSRRHGRTGRYRRLWPAHRPR